MNLLLIVMLAAQSAAPPPPMVRTYPVAPAPPVMIATSPITPPMIRFPRSDEAARPPLLLDVTVTGEGRTLYRGPLRVGVGYGATVNEQSSQAPRSVCPGMRGWDSMERHSLSIQLNMREDEGVTMISASVNWQRPMASGDCGAGSRTVQLSQSARLQPGRSITIDGDAGLRLTLSRR